MTKHQLPDDLEEFRRQLEANEIVIDCVFCGAMLWIAMRKGAPHLMRLSETPLETCPTCTEMHELIQ